MSDNYTLSALKAAQTALRHQSGRCRFHGDDFDRGGMEPWGEFIGGQMYQMPRCDSCKDPYRVHVALEFVDKAIEVER